MVNFLDLTCYHHFPRDYSTFFSFLSLFANPKLHLLFWGLLSLYSLKKLKQKVFFSLEFNCFILINLIMFICGILKIILGRARPYLLDNDISGFFLFSIENDYLSFPSSHTAVAFGVTYFFLKQIKKQKKRHYLAYTLPFFIILSRIGLRQHFATDALLGAVIGIFVSISLIRIKKHLKELYLLFPQKKER